LNFGEAYYNSFERLYADLAEEFGVAFYPFFLAGVAGREQLNQADGIHPNAAGVRVIVQKILPQVEMLLQRSE
jgi:acyl-CoA thioesterase-1